MKKIMFLLGIFILVIGCAPKPTPRANGEKPVIQAQKNDDGEYDLEVLDTQYDYFLNAIARPMSMFSEAYLKNKNAFLVSEWNSYYFSGRYRNIIESSIDYDPSINYGFKYEYKLYQVFAYVSWKYGLKLNGLSQMDVR
ncbi:hypothetical protein EGI11_08540 [Chryseobacterium sp. H3056]|uniref:Lipoprotein n=1 Tax=Kaistella daneshvariae TaxID=2487074 RepID=A0A3N0WRJ5_9FLAO|nr:DUF6146 family protein [Kaistella daneshvariae]ROI07726.1 hypothetical protein EGI11_08540 [Kaistella daneshvariae]